MFKRLGLFMLFFLVVAISSPVPKSYAEDIKIAVEVQATIDANDSVGNRLVYKVKEKFRQSSFFRLTYANEPRLKLMITTLKPSENSNYTMYSAVWVSEEKSPSFPLYLNNIIGTCGSSKVEVVSDDLVAETDKLVTQLLDLYKSQTPSTQ
jgi:hypothetical protein